MSTINGDSPAYPVLVNQVPPTGEHSEIALEHSGMTLRTRLAMAAMQGLISNPSGNFDSHGAAQDAVRYADALIAELNKPKTE